MTTDDGLKGLTDAQITAFFDYVDDERGNAAKAHYKSADSDKSWESKRTGIIANAARAWLAANVHDSGDGYKKDADRYHWLRDNSIKQFDHPIVVTQHKRETGMLYIGPLTGPSLDEQIDAAILAEKGNDNA